MTRPTVKMLRILAALAAAVLLPAAALGPIVNRFTPDAAGMVEAALDQGGAFISRDGTVLRLFPDRAGDFRMHATLSEFSPHIIASVLAAEDKNFASHNGVDSAAVLRSALLNLRQRRVVSGGSTITQQVIRMTLPRPRTLGTKISEALLAMKLEQQMDKDRILEAWLNLAPMFGNIRGFELGSRLLFNKPSAMVTPAEAALLAALPQSPARLSTGNSRGAVQLHNRRDMILSRLVETGHLSPESAAAPLEQPINPERNHLPFMAPHFVEWVVKDWGPPNGKVATSIDSTVQAALETAIRSHAHRLARSGASQASGMIVDTATLEILAMAGSIEYGPRNLGFNNGCAASRSGGSILKPFLYALALESGYSPASVIRDTDRTFRTPQGDYLPHNASRNTYGPVTIRQALGNSLNISAVNTINHLGVKSFFDLLVRLELAEESPNAVERLGLGLAIGNQEISMLGLANAYGTLAHGGLKARVTPFPVSGSNEPGDQGRSKRALASRERMFSEATAHMILDILADSSARLLTFGNPAFFDFPFPVAIKTGTSTNYRDSWLAAVTPRYIILLWAGNFNGSETLGLSGAVACGPILKDLLPALEGAGSAGWFARPHEVVARRVCGFSGQTPGAFCPAHTIEIFNRLVPREGECRFHSAPGPGHVLSAEYSQWIHSRRARLDSDPFRIEGVESLTDPFSVLPAHLADRTSTELSGLPTKEEGPFTGETASGPGIIVVSNNSATNSVHGDLRIVQPHDGDRFVLHPSRETIARLRAEVSRAGGQVTWVVNGMEYDRTGPPYETFLRLERGRFAISALSAGQEAARITIFVE